MQLFTVCSDVFTLCRRPASDYFDGEVLSPCDRRDDILWYTPLSWLNGDRDAWLDMKQRFDRAYTELVSDYRRFRTR